MKKGFTLIELSIVLIIIGLLTGGAFQMIKVMQEKARATEAKQILESAKQAVIAYAINNGKLPTESDFLTMQIRGADNFNLAYYVPTTATNPPNFLITDLCANIDTGFSTQITKPDNTLEIPTPNIAFVIAINGENMQPQTIPATVTSPLIFPRWNAIAMGFPYDDLHVQVTLGELQATTDCQTNKFKIINTTLPVGTVGTPYTLNSTVVTTGGTPSCSTPPTAPCVYTVNGLSGSGLVFSPVTNTISGTPSTANNYPLTFIATNGTAQDTKSLLLVISEPVGISTSSARQACLDACAASSNPGKSCEAQCPK